MANRNIRRIIFHCVILEALVVYNCASSPAQEALRPQATSAQSPIPSPDATALLPENAVLVKKLAVKFSNDGRPGSIALAYTVSRQSNPVYREAWIRVAQFSAAAGWGVAFEQHLDSLLGGDALNIERVTSSSGTEGVVVILQYSGAGTSTTWHVITATKGRFVVLDPTPIRNRALKQRAYVFMGYNRVTTKNDLVIEELSGYSYGRAACCPDRPSIAISQKYTGTSLKLESVELADRTSIDSRRPDP